MKANKNFLLQNKKRLGLGKGEIKTASGRSSKPKREKQDLNYLSKKPANAIGKSNRPNETAAHLPSSPGRGRRAKRDFRAPFFLAGRRISSRSRGKRRDLERERGPFPQTLGSIARRRRPRLPRKCRKKETTADFPAMFNKIRAIGLTPRPRRPLCGLRQASEERAALASGPKRRRPFRLFSPSLLFPISFPFHSPPPPR